MNEERNKGKDDANEINKLRAQIEKLQNELSQKKVNEPQIVAVSEKHPSRSRNITSGILLGIGLISLLVAIPVLWLHRTLLTTDGWVTAVAPLAQDSAVQASVARAAAQEFVEQANVEEWLQRQLPEQSSGLVEPLTFVIEMAIRQFANVVVSSETFANVWSEVNRVSHGLVIAGLSRVEEIGDGQLIERIGELNIDLRAIIAALQVELQSRGFNFTLPENFSSQVTLLQSGQVAQLLNFVRTLDTVAPWLAILAIAAVAGSIGLSTKRRKAILSLGIGILIAALLLIIADSVMKSRVMEQVSPEAVFSLQAASEAYDTITGGLIASLRAAVVLGIILWLGAVLTGPSRSMVAMRHNLQNWIHDLRKNRNPGQTELWIGTNKNIIQIGILIAASIAVVLPSQRTVGYIVGLAVLVVILEFLTEFFGRIASPPQASL